MTHRRRAVALLLVALAATGCGSADPDAASPAAPPLATGTPGAGAATEPAVEITYPEAGSDPVDAGEVIVAVTVRSFDVVDKLGKDPKDGEGHVHYYLDVDEIPTTPGKAAVTDDRRTYHATAETSHRWPGVDPGRHTFGVQLVNNDHTPLEPPVTDEVDIRVD